MVGSVSGGREVRLLLVEDDQLSSKVAFGFDR
jgi:hypothetical protein